MNDDRTSAPTENDRLPHNVSSKRPFMMILCASVILVLSFAGRFTPAQTTMEIIRWKQFSHAKQNSQVGGKMTDIDAISRSGFIVFGDGEFARLSSSLVHTRSPEGKEFHQGFVMYDFDDGSSILAKVDVAGEPRSKQIGTIVFLAGTERFKGITGRGTIYSWMPAQWDTYAEIEASYTLSKE